MPRDSYASLRLPADLKHEVQQIATSQHRSLSNTIQLLLWRGVQEFNKDGALIELRRPDTSTTPRNQGLNDDDDEQFAQDVAREIVQLIMRRSHERKEGSPRKSRDGPIKRRRRAG